MGRGATAIARSLAECPSDLTVQFHHIQVVLEQITFYFYSVSFFLSFLFCFFLGTNKTEEKYTQYQCVASLF